MSTTAMERTRTPSAIETFHDRLQARRDQLVDALKGSGINVDRFIRTAMTAVQNNAELISDVSFQSLWAELLKACRDQLLPDGRQGVIVSYKGKAKWQPMYRGMLDRFEQSEHYKWVTANVHRDDDRAWDVWVDENGQHFLHRPGPGLGKVIETYAAATTKSGAFFLTIVNEPDMAHIKSVARAKSDDSPWNQWPDQMRLKTALKRLCKLLPMPQPLEEFMRSDDEDDDKTPAAIAAPAKRLGRPRGAAQALEQFATGDGEDAPMQDQPEQTTAKGDRFYREPDGPTGNEGQSVREQGDRFPGDVPLDQPAQDAPTRVMVETAYERGKEAKRTGMKRTAVPGEYREAGREPEVEAWRKGWDGEPLGGVP